MTTTQLLSSILEFDIKAITTNPVEPIPAPEPDPEPIPSPDSAPEPDPELDPVPAPS